MTSVEIGWTMIAGMLFLMASGVHIGVSLIILSFLGVLWIKSNAVIAAKMLALTASDALANYLFGMVPMFVLMGLVVDKSNIGRDTFDAAQWLLKKLPGGVGVATVGANAIFAAITGISIASAALFTKVAVPQMLRLGYKPRFAVGAVAGSSVLGMLIPPSLLLILYGIISETSIGQLFRAGIVPGIILAGCFGLGIIVMAIFFPRSVMEKQESMEAEKDDGAGSVFLKLAPSILIILIVLGGIYGGLFTVTEAAAAGAATAIAIAVILRRLTLEDFWLALKETGQITVTVLFMIMAANMYSKMLAFSRIPFELLDFVQGLGLQFTGFLIAYLLLIICLGMILDSISILLIIVPLVLPLVEGFNGDLIWFGIITVIAVEIGLLTPPFGLSVYVVKATLGDPKISLVDIFAGSAPYVFVMLLVLGLLIVYPQLSLVFVN